MRTPRPPLHDPWDDEPTPVQRGGGPSAEAVARALRAGSCPDDRAFDRFLPHRLRLASSQYWTPLVVIRRVADWLARLDVNTIVDIGSGPGKLCVALALMTDCELIGIEQRPHLVDAARRLARRFDVADRVRFEQGLFGDCAIPEADAYYVYNPFGEFQLSPSEHLGDDVELSERRYAREVAAMEAFLDRAPAGTYLIDYNGFGARVPAGYEPIRVDRAMPEVLRIWRKFGSDGARR